MDLDVAEAAHRFVEDMRKDGLGGVRVENWEYSGIWHEQYAIFTLQFDTYRDYGSDYEGFDYDQFRLDLEKVMEERFPGCEIECSRSEYEVMGPRNSEFHKRHADEIEAFIDKNWLVHKRQRNTRPVIFAPKESEAASE